MSLVVEVAGFGLSSSGAPVLVICVQQESFQAWTVYRSFAAFVSLAEQLQVLHPSVPAVPVFNPDDSSIATLDECRASMDTWLQSIAANPMILRTQSMYQFLCVGADAHPPNLEIHWRNGNNGSFDEMEMDDMFDRHMDGEGEGEGEEEYMDNGGVGEINGEWEEDEPTASATCDGNNVFGFTQSVQSLSPKASGETTSSNTTDVNGTIRKPPTGKRTASEAMALENEDDARDGLDIQSLSVVEAEFLFDSNDKSVEGNAEAGAIGAPKRTISLESFQIIKVIGKGSFGKVFLVRDKAHGTLHALKVLKKDYIIRKNQVEHTKTERSVLGYIHHPFIVGLTMAFQTKDKLFFVLDYCAGGELFFHLGKVGRFPEDRARFYAAQITLALEYVHGQDIIYRDLKPENVLLDQYGNVRLTDFGLSKEGVTDHSTGDPPPSPPPKLSFIYIPLKSTLTMVVLPK